MGSFLAGFPDSIMSAWQRIGRAGRSWDSDAFVLYRADRVRTVAGDNNATGAVSGGALGWRVQGEIRLGIIGSKAWGWMMQVSQHNDFPTWETGRVVKAMPPARPMLKEQAKRSNPTWRQNGGRPSYVRRRDLTDGDRYFAGDFSSSAYKRRSRGKKTAELGRRTTGVQVPAQ